MDKRIIGLDWDGEWFLTWAGRRGHVACCIYIHDFFPSPSHHSLCQNSRSFKIWLSIYPLCLCTGCDTYRVTPVLKSGSKCDASSLHKRALGSFDTPRPPPFFSSARNNCSELFAVPSSFWLQSQVCHSSPTTKCAIGIGIQEPSVPPAKVQQRAPKLLRVGVLVSFM